MYLLLLFAGSGRVIAQRSGDYGRYQIILDQQILGRIEPDAPPQPPVIPPSPPPPSWTTDYRLTMITEDLFSGRARVGLYHVRQQIGYLLIEGERYDDHGFVLDSVDYNQGLAVILHQGSRHSFQLESAPEPLSPPETPPARQPPPRTVRRVNNRPEAETAPPVSPPEPRFSSPEELQTHLQNVQMDAIRTGKPPLPIPLTPEMDAQLVQEGILPPLEE